MAPKGLANYASATMAGYATASASFLFLQARLFSERDIVELTATKGESPARKLKERRRNIRNKRNKRKIRGIFRLFRFLSSSFLEPFRNGVTAKLKHAPRRLDNFYLPLRAFLLHTIIRLP